MRSPTGILLEKKTATMRSQHTGSCFRTQS